MVGWRLTKEHAINDAEAARALDAVSNINISTGV